MTVVYLLLGLAGILLFFYFFSPVLKKISYRSNILRGILFFGIIGYLAYDFYMKEKYQLLVVLAMGGMAFIYMIRFLKKKE